MKRFVQVRVLRSDRGDGPGPALPRWRDHLTGTAASSGPIAGELGRQRTSEVLATVRTSVGRGCVVAQDVTQPWLTASLVGSSKSLVGDEHFAVDVDAGWSQRWLDSADVLYGSVRRCAAETRPRFAHLARTHPGCRLLALPLTEGGWALAHDSAWHHLRCAGAGSRQVRGWQSLVPSCVQGGLAAGHALGELRSVSVVQAR